MLDKRMGCESLDSLNSATVKRLASYVFGCIAVRLRIYVGQQQFVGTALAATGFMEQPGAVACQLVRLSTL
jgi:hypothetical protein